MMSGHKEKEKWMNLEELDSPGYVHASIYLSPPFLVVRVIMGSYYYVFTVDRWIMHDN